MSPLSERVIRFVRARAITAPGDRLAVALSGGPDSMALLYLLLEAAPVLGVLVAGVAHLNHGLRGEAADGDEVFCRDVAARLGLPVHIARAEVASLARDGKMSIEAAGHHARAEFFERARLALGATLVATAHTRNDVAETVLLHAARGAGLRGLAGMRPRAGAVARPLLSTGRPDLDAYLTERAIPFRDDASNRDVRIPRNRVRHEVLPALDAAVPGAVGGLERLADIAADEDALLSALAEERGRGLVRDEPGGLAIPLSGLLDEPPAMRRRIVAALIESARLSAPFPAAGLRQVDAVLELAGRGRNGSRLSLPGRTAEIRGNDLWVVSRAPTDGRFHSCEPGVRQIPVPGVLTDTGAGWELTAEVGPPMDAVAAREYSAPGGRAVVDSAAVGSKVYARYRKPGDRFRPLGMQGHRKLQDVFVDAKVGRALRDRVPLVVDSEDRIVWVVGHGIAAGACATGRATGVLLLGFRRLGGLG